MTDHTISHNFFKRLNFGYLMLKSAAMKVVTLFS